MGTEGLVHTLLSLPLFKAEWVLWLLIVLSLVSIAVIVERVWFFYSHRVDLEAVQRELKKHLEAGDFAAAAAALSKHDALETNVVLVGIKEHDKGPESVEDLMVGALGSERMRYEERLGFLATLASNTPYIGLFGTVLGIIRSFKDMSTNMSEAAGSVMAGIAEALIATAVGLLVAIPAVVAFNTFQKRVKDATTRTQLLAKVLTSQLKSTDVGR